ncbi:hypothetical protein PENTCL1PPCAC_14291, partial [Pristionchus entomophagus]
MAASIYAWVYEDPFHSIYRASTATISVLSNGLLLYIIFTTASSAGIGSYRYLLAVFAVCDVVTSFAHAFLQPLVHLTDTGLYFFSHHSQIIIGGKSFATVFCLIFIATYYQTFLSLAYHFVFRLTTVTSGIARSCTSQWSTAHWTILAVVVNILYVARFMGVCLLAFTPSDATRSMAPPEMLELYGVDLRDSNSGFAVISVRDPTSGQMIVHARSVIALILLLSLFLGTGLVIVYCIWRISGVIRSADNDFTTRTRKMQTDLFHAILIQVDFPVLFSYLPLATILLFPVVSGIPLGAFGNVLFSITAISPCVDAFFVLFFIGRFRLAVIRLFRLPFDHHVSST